MNLPNWFKILWWSLLLAAFSYGIVVRFDSYKSGDVTGMDALVFLMWVALVLVPIFKEVEIFGFKFRQEKEVLNPQRNIDTEKNAADNLSKSKAQELLGELNDPMTIEQVENLKKTIADINPAQPEKEEILYRLLAVNQIAVFFEQTYSFIFGSQLKALQFLNGLAGIYSEPDILKPFYEAAREMHKDFYKNYSYDNWLSFMKTTLLVAEMNGNICISVRGQTFLGYLIEHGRSFEKVG